MTTSKFSARAGMLALAMALGAPSVAIAQTSISPAATSNPAQALSENLKALARDPYNVDALIQAGYGALAVGDANAAFGFFARAEELSPSNGRAKAGLGSALTQMEKPKEALRAFEEATALGAGDRDILSDRGLAYDLSGDAKRAQRDYQAALRMSPSDELTRRLALSLGISGDRDAALARLDPLVRQNDQAAWRARAFVLAMNGDAPGAEKIVRMVAPPATVGTMVSFLQRLADMGPSARAHAVHFGTLPSTNASAVLASTDDFRPMDTASAARLASPPVERAIVPQAAPISAKDAKKRAREQEKLARLAERGRKATNSLSTPVTVAATQPTRQPVPSDAIASRVAAAMPQAGEKVAVVKGATALPLPDAITARAAPAPSLASAAQVSAAPSSAIEAPSPLFEVPAAPPLAKHSPAAPLRPTPIAPSPTSVAAEAPPAHHQSAVPTEVAPARNAALLAPASTPSLVEDPAKGLATTNPAVRPVDLPPAQVPQSVSPSVAGAAPVTEALASAPLPQPETAPAASAPVTAPAPRMALTLAEIVNTLELEQETAAAALPSDAQIRAARVAAQKKAAADEKLKAEKLAEEKRIAEEEANARRNPARIWVQVATGNNRSGLPGTWRKLQAQASKSLTRQSAWTVPFRQTNRLLVGPLKSVGDARDLVNSLAKEGIQATTFSSDAGQEISRIGGR